MKSATANKEKPTSDTSIHLTHLRLSLLFCSMKWHNELRQNESQIRKEKVANTFIAFTVNAVWSVRLFSSLNK